jgi:hypothetical protein
VLGTGTVGIEIVAPELMAESSTYELVFTNPSLWQDESDVAYVLRNVTTNVVLDEGVMASARLEIPPLEGFIVDMRNETGVAIIDSTVVASGAIGTFTPSVRPASASPTVSSRFVARPTDYEIRFTESVSDTSLVLAFGMLAIPAPFVIENLVTGEQEDFIILEDINATRNGQYDHGELIVLVTGEAPGTEPVLAGGRWRANWSIRFVPPDPQLEPDVPVIPPSAGSSLRFQTSKPFQTGDRVTFDAKSPSYDVARATAELDNIYVVPNPYIATSNFEPANTFRAGRGERRIYFMNLPAECTIRIYTITGRLVQTLHHRSTIDDGQLGWNLVSRDEMNISFGVYIYHVDAPGVGETVGRFAVIK